LGGEAIPIRSTWDVLPDRRFDGVLGDEPAAVCRTGVLSVIFATTRQ
jgi:hypothetical protein